MVFVRQKDFTLKEGHRCEKLDARIDPTLSHTTTSVLCTTFFASVWGQTTGATTERPSFPRLDHPDFLRSNHSRNMDNPGNFGDCMKGIFFFFYRNHSGLTHAYQLICLKRHLPVVPRQKFRLSAAKDRYPHFSHVRTTISEKGNVFQVWDICTDGGTRLADGETLAGRGAVARSLHGKMHVMFGQVITTEAHLAFAGARVHFNCTVEVSAIVEALFFLGLPGPVAREACSCFCVIASMLLVVVWA